MNRLRGACLAVATVAAVAAPGARADTFVVTQSGDPAPGPCDDQCSVREAIIAANEREGPDTVSVPLRTSHSLSIASTGEDKGVDGDLDVTSGPLTIVHRGRGTPNIEATGRDRVFDIENAEVRIEGVAVSFGKARRDDGGGNGGGINAGAGSDVTVVDSWIYADKAPNGNGGGIYVDGTSSLRAVNSAFNSGAREGGGGIAAAEGATVEIVRGFFGKCTARRGGAVLADGRVEIDSTLIGYCGALNDRKGLTRHGGGIYVGEQGSLELENSTLTANRALVDGGAIYGEPGAEVAINAATIARNTANSDGIGDGTGGGLFAAGPGQGFEVENTIIALNKADGEASDCFGGSAAGVASGGANLLSTLAGGCGFARPDDLVSPEPGLARASGRTGTIPLLPGSPAIDAAGPSAPPRDQRGRRRDQRPDIGAFELGARRRERRVPGSPSDSGGRTGMLRAYEAIFEDSSTK